MHENLSKLKKSRIPLHKSKYGQNKTYCLEIHTLVTLKKNKKMIIKVRTSSLPPGEGDVF